MTPVQGNVVLRHIRDLTAAEGATRLPDRQLLERFALGREEAAFTTLVRRHGPLVLGVCRRVLGQEQDAEDAFQATFLALARQATSAGRRAALATWLYRVAYRTALRTRQQTTALRRREERIPPRAQADPLAEVTGRELLAALDEELQRLPERLRAPLVLCYLEGKARDEAARELGWSLGTLKRRLERGRAGLHARLSRRGLSLGTLLAGGIAGAAVPSARAAATARAALLAAGARVSLPRLLWAVVAAGLLAVVGGLMAYRAAAAAGAADERPTPQLLPPKGPAPAPAAAERQEQRVSGRVLDPDGKPVAGAKVYLLQWNPPGQPARDAAPPKVWAETDGDGRFSFTAVVRGELFVTAAGFGPGWDTTGAFLRVMRPGEPEPPRPAEYNLLVRLARDDVPVSGRLLDVQGEPVAGATIRVFTLNAPPDGNLDKWVEAVRKRAPGQSLRDDQHLSSFSVDGLSHFFPPVTTDRDGRFRITGVGRERVVAFTVEGPAIETRVIHAVTRPGLGANDLRIPETTLFFGDRTIKEARLKPYYPPTFTHTADPGRVVSGVVRDRDSGKPVAGAVVRSEQPVRFPAYYNRTTTDKDGRYRLTGMPVSPVRTVSPRVGPGDGVVALPPPDGEPYLAMRQSLPAGNEGVASFDFALPGGAWLEGQVKDRATGRGVPAALTYFLLDASRPTPGGGALYRDPYGPPAVADAEGKFRLLVARERGLLGVSALGETAGHYRTGVGADKIEGGAKDTTGAVTFPIPFGPLGAGLSADQFDALLGVKPENGVTTVRRELELVPGRPLTIQVRGPDGKPLAGAQAFGQSAGPLASAGWSQRPLPAEFSVYGLAPGAGRTLLVVHPEKNLAARYEIKADETGSVALTLQPAAAVVGRLVDGEGRPRKDILLNVRFRLGGERGLLHLGRYKTDAGGKFRIDGLVPGVSYDGYAIPRPDQPYAYAVFDDLSLKGGEAKDLGNVKAQRGDE